MTKEISFPFRLDQSGAIAIESDPNQQVVNHMISLVGTQPGERIGLTGYGVNTLLSLFEPNDELEQQHLLTTVKTAAAQWESGVVPIKVVADTTAQQEGAVILNVLFARANSGGDSPIDPSQVYTATVKANGDIR